MDDFTVHRDTLAGDPFVAAAAAQKRGRDCFFCLSGWVFLGSLDHDGEEVTEAIRCRRCGGSGVLKS